MKYKLYKNGTNNTDNILKEVLNNRGITDYITYLNLSEKNMCWIYNLNNILDAIEMFEIHINNNDSIAILIDEDVDGFCSAALMYMYIKKYTNSSYPVEYILHKQSKAHGITEDIVIPKDTKLLIIPDAGTNDVGQCKKLKTQGIDILILDHHESETENPYACIVNNQMSPKYENKQLCGTGIVFRFLQALDEYNWSEYSDDFYDLVALANIADVMDVRSYETKYLINLGLTNITNKFLKAVIESQDYVMFGHINIHNIAWYVVPIINALIRIGTLEEKDLLFKAFTEQDNFFEYKKKAAKDKPSETVRENIYQRTARLCKNAKSRQDRMKKNGTEKLIETIECNNLNGNKIICTDVSSVLDSRLAGLVAASIAEKYNKPCILFNSRHNPATGCIELKGSARNSNNSSVINFKDIVNSSGIMNAAGHQNAFGIVNLIPDKYNTSDKEEILKEINQTFNKLLKNIDYDNSYMVDFILQPYQIDNAFIREFSVFDDLVGHGIDSPLIAVEGITLQKDDIEILGKNNDTVKFTVNDVEYIKFKCDSSDKFYAWLVDDWSDKNTAHIAVVGKPAVNTYNGACTSQIIIKDIEIRR